MFSRQTSQDLQSSSAHEHLQSSKSAQSCVSSQAASRWTATTPQPLPGDLVLSDNGTGHASDTNHTGIFCQTSSTDGSTGQKASLCASGTAALSMSGNLPGSKIPETPQPTKMCSNCCRRLPLTDFRFRNKAAGTRMCQCSQCHTDRQREREQIKRARKAGWDIHKTASQIATSKSLTRSLWLLDQLVDAMGGPQNLLDRWREECLKLARQKRSSTRLSRMYEMVIAMACQTRGLPWKE